jgi:hypothetical protein
LMMWFSLDNLNPSVANPRDSSLIKDYIIIHYISILLTYNIIYMN